jgi:DNA-binding PadR family transcriptional regulator
MTSKAKHEDRLGPVNPFTVGSVFVEAAKKLEWVVEDTTERHKQYFITPKGFEEMSKLGMNIERILLYRQPPEEQRQHRQQQQHQQRTQQHPQRQQQRTQRTHHRSGDRRRH